MGRSGWVVLLKAGVKPSNVVQGGVPLILGTRTRVDGFNRLLVRNLDEVNIVRKPKYLLNVHIIIILIIVT